MISRPDLPVVSFLSVVLVLIPLPWHWRARNVATLSMIAWLSITNLTRGINSILWADNIEIKYHVYCDIVTKITIGIGVALPSAALCICRHLASVASTSQARATARDKRRRSIFELFLCFGLPALIMALHYIVQGHRFDIHENFGCSPTTYISWPALVIIWLPIIGLSIITMIYAAIALRFFIIRRIEFESVLQGSASSLTTGRYLRLMGLSVTQMLWAISIGTYVLFLNINDNGLRVYDTWEHVHRNFERVDRFPALLIPKFYQDRLLLSWWVVPSSAMMFFLFFGFGEEAMSEYRGTIIWIRRNILRQDVKGNGSSASLPTLPSRVHIKFQTGDALDTSSIGAYEPKWDTLPLDTSEAPTAQVKEDASTDTGSLWSDSVAAESIRPSQGDRRSSVHSNRDPSTPEGDWAVRVTMEKEMV